MAIWESLSKKASETTAKVMQQTKNFAETTKLNGMVTEEEKRIDNIYYHLGKRYASIYRENPAPEFAEMIAAIIASEEKIAQYKVQIQELKGVVRCEKCGGEVAKGAAFCNSCGAPIVVPEPPVPDTHVKCSGCGALIEKSMRFCTSCGKPMSAPVPQVAPVAAPEAAPAPQPVAEQPAQTLCANCGKVLPPDVVFCTECGAKVQ